MIEVRDREADTLEDLEWHRLAEAVVARCRGPRAKNPELPLASTAEATRAALAETDEALRALSSGEPLPLEGLVDVREHVARVDRMGALDALAIRDITRMLGAARTLRRYLGARRDSMPTLHAACPVDPTLDRLEEELRVNVEADGTLSDHASPELRRLRTETANLRARIVGRLEELAHKHANVLSDTFVTQRDGRYVLPLRTDSHEKMRGIVHGASSSGATVFIEPESVIEQGNRLTIALAEQAREEARILAVLTELVRERLTDVVVAADSLDHADLRAAMAKFGRDIGARVLPVLDEGRIDLREARHPLLVLDGGRVVPNDVVVESGRTLVISGPNAGGKTVALKMLGLAALMMRAGLPFPAAEGSSAGFFDLVLSDVGDDQSLTKNLSTFSAHVRRMVGILEVAAERSLVLLDELAGGTDPEEGAALACAIVDALCRAGAATAVTTHYEPLKAMATRDARLRNASVGFDVERIEPTFALTLDLPGASSALAVARRFGMPERIVAHARDVLPEQSRSFDELVRKLDGRMQEVASLRAAAEDELRNARKLEASAEEKLAAIERGERAKLGRETTKLLEQVRRARDELRDTRKAMRAAKHEADLDSVRKSVESTASVAHRASSSMRDVELDLAGSVPLVITVGDRLFVPRLGREVEILDEPSKGRVRVAAGPIKLTVDLADLRPPSPQPKATDSPRPGLEGPKRPAIATSDNTLDIRGLRADDAASLVETFLDRLYGGSEPYGFILHGVGTGALRDAVREVLARLSKYVLSQRPGTIEEGGPRLTVVELR